jgi:hypothetical protein
MADVVTPVAAPAAAVAPSSTSAAMTAAPVAPVAAPTAAGAVGTESVNPGAWMAGFNDDLKGYVGAKGFKDPASVVDAYKNLEKLQGVPQERLMKLPEQFYDDKGVLTADGRAIYERLGAPKEAKDYGIEVPKEGGDPKLMEHFTKIFHEAGIPKAAAQKIVAEWNGYQGAAAAAVKEVQAAEFRNQQQALQKEWGAATEQNTRIAADATRRLGWDAKKIDAVSAAIGHAETMKLLCNLGKAVGESAFISGRQPAGPLEPATAVSRINELKADKEFGNRLLNGDAEAKATWERLHQQAFQGQINLN